MAATRLDTPPIQIAGAAVLAALSVIIQILPPLFITPWYMRIDLVAVSWVLCWILFGFKASLLCLLISVPLVGILGPFAGGWVGAIMKSVSSVWMFAIPAAFAWRTGSITRLLEKKWVYALVGILAIAVRDVVCVIFNLYFALPFFFGWNTEAIISVFSSPNALSFVGHSLGLVGLGAFVAEVTFWNTVQGAIDVYVSLIIGTIVFRTIRVSTR